MNSAKSYNQKIYLFSALLSVAGNCPLLTTFIPSFNKTNIRRRRRTVHAG